MKAKKEINIDELTNLKTKGFDKYNVVISSDNVQ